MVMKKEYTKLKELIVVETNASASVTTHDYNASA